MKKLVSIVLSLVLVLGMSTISFAAASGRIEAANAPIDTNVQSDYEVKPGDTLSFPLTADMFDWSGTPGSANEPVSRAQGSNAGLEVIPSISKGNKAIKRIWLAYEASEITNKERTATVKIEFEDGVGITNEMDFTITMFLRVRGSRQSDSRTIIEGVVKNKEVSVWDQDYVDISDGRTYVAESFLRNLEMYLGNEVSVTANIFDGQKFYGQVDNSITSEDSTTINKYPAVEQILSLKSVNLEKGGTTVRLDYPGYYVYNQAGRYVGRTSNTKLPYSSKYYLASKDLGSSITVSGSGSGSDNSSSSESSTSSTPSTPSIPPTTSGTVSKETAIADTQAAIKASNAAGSNVAIVRYRNKAGVTAEALQAMASTGKASNKTVQVNADTVSNNVVVGRVTMNPALASKLTADTKFGLYTDDKSAVAVKSHFQKWFSNNMVFASFDHKGNFGMNVNVALKVDLKGLNTNNLYFYTYNASTNKYARITNTNTWIDSNGYLRFTTTSGNELVVSDGPLTSR